MLQRDVKYTNAEIVFVTCFWFCNHRLRSRLFPTPHRRCHKPEIFVTRFVTRFVI